MKPNTINKDHQKQLELFGRFLRELRLSNGFTQEELSDYTNVHRGTIQRLEHGKNVTLLSVIEIAEALDIDLIKELIGD